MTLENVKTISNSLPFCRHRGILVKKNASDSGGIMPTQSTFEEINLKRPASAIRQVRVDDLKILTAFALVVLGGCQTVTQFWGIMKYKEKLNNNKCQVHYTIIFYKFRKKAEQSTVTLFLVKLA